MSAPLMFVRDGRTLPFVPVTTDALEAITAACPRRRLGYARSLYLALLELANENRSDRAAVSRKILAERSGASRELISDLRPILEEAGVVIVSERHHGREQLEHEWTIVEPDLADPPAAQARPPVPRGQEGPASQAHLSLEEKNVEGEGGSARSRDARDEVPDDFPDDLRPHARVVMRVLRDVAQRAGAREVRARAVGLVLMAHPRHELVREAYALASWADGQPRPIRDVVATYRNWLGKRGPMARTEVLPGEDAPADPAGVTRLRPNASSGERLQQRSERRRAQLAEMGALPPGAS